MTVPALRDALQSLVGIADSCRTWQVLLEYPLYRLRRRIDAVVISPSAIVVIELKTEAVDFISADEAGHRIRARLAGLSR